MATDQYNVQWASDLGWKAGEWPRTFIHNGCEYHYDHSEGDKEGDLICVWYIPITFPNRKKMKVYND